MRLVFVPQYPAKLRYQEWWFRELPEQLSSEFDEILILGADFETLNELSEKHMFSPIRAAIDFELVQIKEYMDMKVYSDDVLFHSDLSFPGLFSNILHHKTPAKIFSFCHATSLNTLDYFEKVRYSKTHAERSFAEMSTAVFVGSRYHKDKLATAGITNTVVSYLPYPPYKPQINMNRTIKIASASRPTPQKVDIEKERYVERYFKTNVKRHQPKSWEDYYFFLGNSKVLLITAKEETFGYQVVDAVLNGCIPVAPYSFSYPELLSIDYLYDDEEEMIEIIQEALDGRLGVPELKCGVDMKRFYQTLSSTMKGY
jgi:hypothetical protein